MLWHPTRVTIQSALFLCSRMHGISFNSCKPDRVEIEVLWQAHKIRFWQLRPQGALSQSRDIADSNIKTTTINSNWVMGEEGERKGRNTMSRMDRKYSSLLPRLDTTNCKTSCCCQSRPIQQQHDHLLLVFCIPPTSHTMYSPHYTQLWCWEILILSGVAIKVQQYRNTLHYHVTKINVYTGFWSQKSHKIMKHFHSIHILALNTHTHLHNIHTYLHTHTLIHTHSHAYNIHKPTYTHTHLFVGRWTILDTPDLQEEGRKFQHSKSWIY